MQNTGKKILSLESTRCFTHRLSDLLKIFEIEKDYVYKGLHYGRR